MDKISISAIIIARDEEENIERCIRSLQGCVDEIVVIIDDRTTDRTEEFIKNLNVIYKVRKWEGYVKSKEYALSLTSHEWVLWIDADESLTKDLRDEINERKQRLSDFAAYTVPRKAYFLNKWIRHSGWYPGRVTRLFNKILVTFTEKDVHEHLIINGKTGQLMNDIEHWTDPTIEHYFKKFNIYTSLAANELAIKGKKASVSDIIVRPAFLFFKMYFLRQGYLDGLHGFILAIFSSAYVFTKYCKLKEINSTGWRDDHRYNTQHQ